MLPSLNTLATVLALLLLTVWGGLHDSGDGWWFAEYLGEAGGVCTVFEPLGGDIVGSFGAWWLHWLEPWKEQLTWASLEVYRHGSGGWLEHLFTLWCQAI